MRRSGTLFLVFILFFLFSSLLHAQSFNFNCTTDTTINFCNNSQCVTLKSRIPDIHSLTGSYTVNPTSSVNGCFPVYFQPDDPGGTPTNFTLDDKYSGILDIGFPFPFYGTYYPQLVASTNGYVSFDLTRSLQASHYQILNNNGILSSTNGVPLDLPSTLYDKALIMGPYHDVNPALNTSPQQRIQYIALGTAPYRKWILSFYKAPLFQCTTLIENTHQIILYESTGIIEVIVFSRQACSGWNNGRAMIGLQNFTRDLGIMVPGRAASSPVWQGTNMNESYRFVPSEGSSLFKRVELYDLNGNLLRTGTTAAGSPGMLEASFDSLCPPVGTTSYIIKSVYKKIDDSTVEITGSDTVRVNRTTATELNATATITPAACGSNGSLTVAVANGIGTAPFAYVLDGGAPQNSVNRNYTFNNLPAGNHTVVVTDAVGCSSTVNKNVTASGTLTVNSAITPTSCAGASNGSVTFMPQNGTAPFHYSLSGMPFQDSSNTYNNLNPGTYSVIVKDNSTCQQTVLITIPLGPALTTSVSVIPPACPGAANGSFTVNPPTSGLPPYEYSFMGAPFQSNNVFTNLQTGNYFVSVRDAQGCTINNRLVTIPAGTGTLNASSTVSGTSCVGANNGSITIVPANGSAPYQYSLDNGVTWNPGLTIPNLAPGSYTFIVKDNGGCSSAPISATITQGNALLATAVSTATSCSGVDNGTITVTPTNGSGPYTFKLDGGTPQSNNIFTNVASGNHSVIVTDAANCVSNAIPVTVAVGPAITGTAITTATSCNGALNGSVTVTATNGSGPYSYQIDNNVFQSSNTFNGLGSGSHSIIIKDAFGCTSAPINVNVIAGAALTGTVNTSATSCNGVNNGSITVLPTNGSTPFTYSVDGSIFQSSNIFTGQNSGSHTIVIKDNAGCVSAPIPVNIAVGPPITGTVSSVATSCNGAVDGIVNVIPNNGMAPWQYKIDNGIFQGAPGFNGLAAGNHTVIIQDAAGCVSAPISIAVAAGNTLTATVATTPTSCSGALNGTVTVTPTNSSGIYQYSLDGINFQSSNSFTGLANGIYSITFKNNSGCQATIQATVNPGQPLTATVVPSNVSCNGGNNGSVLISISTNAVPPYQFSLDGLNWQQANNFSGLVAGSYNVSFKDANNCAGNTAFTITQPAVLSISLAEQAALCNGQNNGLVLVAATGGVSPYQYSITGTNYQSSNTFNLPAGNYTVYVKDNSGCIKSQAVTINEPAALSATTSTTNASCDGGKDGTITVSVNGGTSGYQYSVDGISFQTSNIINVAAGNYTVTIKDANGCTITRIAAVGLTNNLNIIPVADTTICEGIAVQLQPNTNATQFTWTPAIGLSANNVKSPNASPSITTEYIVKARLGVCAGEDTIIVNVLPAPVADAGPPGDICYGQSYQLQGSGGVEYFWSPSTYLNNSLSFDPVVTPDQTIQYSLSVRDANGCRSLQPDVVIVNVVPPIVVNISRDTVVALGDVFQLHASSVATDYLWSPGFGLSDVTSANPMVTVTADITYSVIASTPAGCKGEASVTIKVYEGPQIYVPNAFTPNNDGKNDVFKPFPVGISKYNYFRVFNRWGQMIYSTTNFNQGWDGTVGGKMQPTGTYVWMVEGITKENKKITKRGTVVLVR